MARSTAARERVAAEPGAERVAVSVSWRARGGRPIEAVPRARVPDRVPVVLSRDEVGGILKHVTGQVWIIVVLLYGAGLRIQECLELRVKDIQVGDRRNRPVLSSRILC